MKKVLGAALMVVLLTACSGGGGGGNTEPAPTQPPAGSGNPPGGTGNGSGGTTPVLTAPTLSALAAEYTLQTSAVSLPLQWQYSGTETVLRWQILQNEQLVTEISNAAARSHSVSLSQAGAYQFAVRACSAKECKQSNTVATRVVASPVVPEVPALPGIPMLDGIAPEYTLRNGEASIAVSWHKPSGPDGSRFEWYVNDVLQHSQTIGNSQTGSYTHVARAAGTLRFSGRLCAQNQCSSSSTISTTIVESSPAVPVVAPLATEYTLSNGEATITVSWTATGEKGDRWQLLVNDTSVHSAALSNTAAGNQTGTYSYRARQAGNLAFVVWLCKGTLCSESVPASTTVKLAEPPKEAAVELPADVLGFYDTDKNGQTRNIRNDLGGSLAGMVQFGQSHTVDPNGNASKNMPMLIAQREALLLFTPQTAVNTVKVTAAVNGVQQGVLEMRQPGAILRADSTNSDGRPDAVYSRRAFTAILPWDWIQPGLELSFEDNNGKRGTLAANQIDMSAPSELTLYFIRLGMLTDYPNNDDHYFLGHPAEAAADYFQTLPVAQLTVGSYEPMRLSEVMIADGTIYTSRSNDDGDVYSGDMRGDVAKSQFSIGVDFANQGVVARDMSQWYPWISNIITSHHAQGLYANGVQMHGLSGGGGIGTLYASIGNELSHELGHNYSLGHYPGQNGNDYFWSGHHADSGWGYIAHRARMRANFYWNGGLGQGINKLNYKNLYSYHSDSMSGGEIDSAFSYFTHYTGYSARIIQNFLSDHAVTDTSSATDWRKWNASNRQMAEHSPAHVQARLKKMSVPVITLIGAYVPSQNKALIYPAFRANHGHTFQLPAAASSGDRCWLDIGFQNGSSRTVALPATQIGSSKANQFAVNIEEAERPNRAKLFCQRSADGNVARELYNRAIAVPTTAMPKYVTVGKARRYTDLAAVELPRLQASLLAVANPQVPVLDSDTRILLDSYRNQLDQLSAQAYSIAQRYLQLQQQGAEIDSFMTANGSALDAGNSAVLAQLRSKLSNYGLAENAGWSPAGNRVTVEGKCLLLEGTVDAPTVVVKACGNGLNDRWFQDARGAIHPAHRPGLCLGGSTSSRVTAAACRPDSKGQSFVYENKQVLRWASNTQRAMDLDRGNGYPIMYGYHGGSNQQWTGLPQSDNPLYMLLSEANLNRLARLP